MAILNDIAIFFTLQKTTHFVYLVYKKYFYKYTI